MSEDKWAELRKPFPSEAIDKLPKFKVPKTSNGKTDFSKYIHCDICGGNHPKNAVHLDYVGHAYITERLNEVDPTWQLVPMALTDKGTPLMADGGCWWWMTLLGVTHICFGDANGKVGADATKEMIGDAIRNGAMRFGVGLDLWKKEKPDNGSDDNTPPDNPRSPNDATSDDKRPSSQKQKPEASKPAQNSHANKSRLFAAMKKYHKSDNISDEQLAAADARARELFRGKAIQDLTEEEYGTLALEYEGATLEEVAE